MYVIFCSYLKEYIKNYTQIQIKYLYLITTLQHYCYPLNNDVAHSLSE